jgi:dTDP-glucose pyrophosphorylase
MLNIVIPMAGAGSRFSKAGFLDPKPLIPVFGRPMIQLVVDNLRPNCKHQFIFICQKDHVEKYDLKTKLELFAPGCKLIELSGLTEGAACTVLAAREWIDNDSSLMIANSDQYVDVDINNYLSLLNRDHLDGLIMTMTASDPKWSFAAIDGNGWVTRVAEKEPISPEATVGIYNFSKGSDYVRAADKMIQNNERVNGEFYVAPVYNTLIEEGAHIGISNIGNDSGTGMFGIGTPADLDLFVSNPIVQAWFR